MHAGEPLIVVIDDDEAICRSLARMLGASGYRTRTYLRAAPYLGEADALEPVCVLADIRMPELDGIALALEMRAAGTDAPIIFMTATGDVTTVVDAMKMGAVDLLPKPFTAESLLSAVGRAIEASNRTDEAHRSLVSLWRVVGRLTPREAEVCALVTAGSANKIVAAQIGITEKTVKVHRGRVMHKLAAPSLAELVRIVDRLVATSDRASVRLDGIEITRPRAAEIILEAVTRTAQRASSSVPLQSTLAFPALLPSSSPSSTSSSQPARLS